MTVLVSKSYWFQLFIEDNLKLITHFYYSLLTMHWYILHGVLGVTTCLFCIFNVTTWFALSILKFFSKNIKSQKCFHLIWFWFWFWRTICFYCLCLNIKVILTELKEFLTLNGFHFHSPIVVSLQFWTAHLRTISISLLLGNLKC